MNSDSDIMFEVTERGFEFLTNKIQFFPELHAEITSERNVVVNKVDLWGKKEPIGIQKYLTFKLVGLDLIKDSKSLNKIELYLNGCQGDEWNEDFEFGLNQKYLKTETLLKYVIFAYVARGKFVSKNKADDTNPSTIDEATKSMFDATNKTWIHNKLKFNTSLRQDAESLISKTIHWMKKKDFNEFGEISPEWSTYFNKLNEVAHSEIIDLKKATYVGGILQTFLRVDEEKTKKEKFRKEYIGIIGEEILFHGKLLIELPCFNTSTFTYLFKNLDNSIIKWYSDKNMNLKLGRTYCISGQVKSHEVDIDTKQPTTVIINGKLNGF